MPTTRITPLALPATMAAVVCLAACSGTGGRDMQPVVPRLDAAGLAALALAQPPAALPSTVAALDGVHDALTRTLPLARAAAGQDEASVAGALAAASRAVAVSRGDPAHLCGPRTSSPLSALSTSYLTGYLAEKPENGLPVQATLGSTAGRDACGTLRWSGPGVVVGPQDWTVAPGGQGADLTVQWAGTIGYVLVDGEGRPEPWRLDGHAGYGLRRSPEGWRLATWTDDTRAELAQGWPADVPVPDGYLPVPDTPASDPAAVAAVRQAAHSWRVAPAATSTVDAAADRAGTNTQGTNVGRLTGTTVAAPVRGDAHSTLGYDTGAAPRTLHLDGGRRTLTQVLGRPRAVPGTPLPGDLRWTAADNTAPSPGRTGYTDDPFAVAALLGETDAAAPAACPPGLTADRCYTGLVVTGDRQDPLAGQFTTGSRLAGRAWLLLDIGLDAAGRPAFLRLVQQARRLGEPYSTVTGTTTWTAWPDTPPPPAPVPDPATVAYTGSVDF